ncbi:MAG: hypothetical protein AYK18_04545 [Theionarchaea archaeon DG-70]|nr:MAG: hypothetical protein AYK18_04545 [Theionarchaea archaeon DG-70]
MPTLSVGQELLNVPFADMVRELALAIAQGQYALDMNSVQVAQNLAEIELPAESVIIAIIETRDADGNLTGIETVYNTNPMPLLVYGLEPRFYEFSESIIEVKITITIRLERSIERTFDMKFSVTNRTELEGSWESGWLASILVGKSKASLKNTTEVAFATSYNAKYSQKYTFEATGSSLLRTTIKSVPPPARLIPRITIKED